MTAVKTLRPSPITAADFAPYGTVLDKSAAHSYPINDGYATRHDRLAVTDIAQGAAQIALFSATPRRYPCVVDMMERHPLATQAFYPLQNHVWHALVCAAETPTAETLRAFTVPGDIGVQYHRNIWHYPLLVSAERQDFLVVDYCGAGDNLELHTTPLAAEFAP